MRFRMVHCIAVLLTALILLALPMRAYAGTLQQSDPLPTSELDEALGNLTYISDFTESGAVELEDGQFEDADNLVFATLANRPRAYGDINGDGALDAVVWLATNTGGSGVFVDLAAVTDVETDPVNVAITLVGDRTQVQSIEIDEDGVITVEVVTQGPEDPMCCPTQIERQQYVLDDSVLALTNEEVIGVVGAEDESESTDVASEVLTDTADITATTEVTEEAVETETAPEVVIVSENPFEEGILENATYLTEYLEDGEVTLVDGVFDDAENRIHIELVDEPRLYGDVDGDGVADALVVIFSNTGGSGGFFDLAVVLNQDGVAYNAAIDFLGDRVDLQSIDLAAGGKIRLRMITQGPEDPMCCPTLLVERDYSFADDALVLDEEIDVVAAEAAAAAALASTPASELEEFTPLASPIVATLALSSANVLTPDPALVAVVGGPGELAAIDATSYGASCTGWIPPAPDAVVQWSGEAESLRFFTVGSGDPMMLVVAPDGSITCNDDMQVEVYNPLVIVDDPQPGRYAVFVGVYNPSVAPATSLLVATTRELDPLTYGAVLPELAVEAAEGDAAIATEDGTGADVILPDNGPDHVTVSADELPLTVDLVGGGNVAMFEQGLSNTLCTGFASAAPIYNFALDDSASAMDNLVIFFEAEVDTTLIVRDPYGLYQCVDDIEGTLNPWMSLAAVPGEYELWVGTYATDTEAAGVLTIGSDPAVAPAVLLE